MTSHDFLCDFYERWKAEGKGRRIDLETAISTGWRRLAYRCLYHLWQLGMMLCCIGLLVALVTPIATIWMIGQSGEPTEILKLGILIGSVFGLPSLVGMCILGSLEGTVWPTWWSC